MKMLVALVLFASSLLGVQMSWNPPTTLSTLGVDSSRAVVEMDQNGNATAAWIENGLLVSKSLPVNGSWGSLNTISQTQAASPRLVVSPAGVATAIWLDTNNIVTTSSCPLNGSWATPAALSSSGASSPQLSVDTSGNLVAIWARNGNIESVTKLAGGSWPIVVDTIVSNQATSPFVSIGANGTIAAIWTGLDLNSISSVYSATKTINGTWGVARMLSTSGQNSGQGRISVDPQGNICAAFVRWNPIGNTENNVVCQVVSQPNNGAWTSPLDLSHPGIRLPQDVRVGLDDYGNAIILWTVSFDGSSFHLQCSLRSGVNGSWSAPYELLGGNLAPCNLDALQIPGGDYRIAILVYCPGNPLNIYSTSTSLSSYYAGTWTSFACLSTNTPNAHPKISGAASGGTVYATAVWTHYNGSNLVIQTASGTQTLLTAPTNVAVTQSKTDYKVISEYENTLTWTAPSYASSETGYLIYRNGIQVAELYSPATQYVDYNQVANQSITYGVAAINFVTYAQSPITSVVFPTR